MRRSSPTALIVLGALALALTGCGSGGGESTAQTTTAQRSSAVAPDPQGTAEAQQGHGPKRGQGQPRQEPEPSPGGGKRHQPVGSRGAGAEPAQGQAPTDPAPLPNQGTKAPAPGVPTPEGADNSIQSFGLEAESPERIRVAATLKAYLDAQAAGRFEQACSYLSARVRTSLEALGRQSRDSSLQDCPAVMGAFLAKTPEAELANAASIRVLSMRVDGDDGFLIYEDGKGTPSELVMSREGGEWKVGALMGRPLGLGG